MTELKPCPFCGGEADTQERYDGIWTVFCKNCGTESGFPCSCNEHTEAEAVAAWNTRAERTCRMERIEEEERILHGWLECSDCGPVYPPAANGIQNAVRYCPYCGAKVVKHG